MSGGIPRITNSTATLKNDSTQTGGLPLEEQVKRKRAGFGPSAIDPQTGRAKELAPDLADIALRDASSGKVRKVRGGSTRESILGTAMGFAAVLAVVGWAWLRAAFRGEL